VSIVDTFLKKRNSSPAGEMSFLDHIEELRWHVIRSLIGVIVAAVFMWSNIEWIFSNIILGPAQNDFISYKAMCRLGELLHVPALCMNELHIEFQNTVLSGQFMMSFSVAFMLGFIAAFPYIFWEFWRFIKPALKPGELKYARGIVFWSSLLFFTGIFFAYYVIAPFTINFLFLSCRYWFFS
jgi:sec-independent protein translocase protein TatC